MRDPGLEKQLRRKITTEADTAIAWYQKNPIMKSVAFLNVLKSLTEPNPPLVANPQVWTWKPSS